MIDIDFWQMFRSLPAPHMVLDAQLRFVDMNDAYLRMTQRARGELVGRFVFDAFPEEEARREALRRAFVRACAGEANSLIRQPFALHDPEGGLRQCWFTCHHVPLRDRSGRLCGVMQQAEDVTQEVASERLRDALTAEFDHRVKNLLTTVASIARRTSRSATSTDAFVAGFEARIQAMARTHSLLVGGGWDRLSLGELARSALAPFVSEERPAEVAGPEVDLSGRQAQALGLAFHELAINATKHGALAEAQGRLSVCWSVRRPDPGQGGAPWLEIVWLEKGLRGLQAPEEAGFGTTLIERVLPAEIGGSIEREFLPSGLRCIIGLPLAHEVSTSGAWLPPAAESARPAASASL